jgi:hypothetical protein
VLLTNSLHDKTVTITTIQRQVVHRVFAQHGGTFANAAISSSNSPTSSSIVKRRTNIGGLTVGEHGKPELITVTPLTRNPSDVADKTISLDTKNDESDKAKSD